MNPEVAVAMSGGVDSSTAAALLREEGVHLVGLTMRLWRNGSTCCSAEDVGDAAAVAATLGIPHHVVDLSRQFRRDVLEPSVREYTEGRTPNPCVLCNEKLKFGLLLQKARELGAHHLATGHYARVEYDSLRKRSVLKRGFDASKDQSYWLSTLPQESLASVRLPLGDRTKEETRQLAASLGLKTARKRESQDVCWVGDFQKVVKGVTALKPGPILDVAGNQLGEHGGIQFYTIGQRRGLGIAAPHPLYVLEIDHFRNALIVGSESELYSIGFTGTDPNWIGVECLSGELEVDVRVRYRGRPARGVIRCDGESVSVRFLEPERAVTPGQLAVFYREEEVIGACWINRVGC